MCKERIESIALVKGVKTTSWDKEEKTLTAIFRSDKTDVETISTAIAEGGHDNQYAKAPEKSYTRLPKCCRYREVHTH